MGSESRDIPVAPDSARCSQWLLHSRRTGRAARQSAGPFFARDPRGRERPIMAETLLEFQKRVLAPDGSVYEARACGGPMNGGGMWEGWIEFVPVYGGPTLRSGRETTQPNRADAEYWSTGL